MPRIGIICAAERELAPFLPHIERCTETKKAMLTFYEGFVGRVPVVALFCGVCKTNAAVATQILIDRFNVDAVINSGTAGGMSAEAGLLDIVVATDCAHHDVHEDILTEYHPYLPSRSMPCDEDLLSRTRRAAERLTGHRVLFGRMATGEQFIESRGREEINAALAPLTVDMETASIAQACFVNSVPFIAVRTITDTEDSCGEDHFIQNCAAASAASAKLVLELLREIK